VLLSQLRLRTPAEPLLNATGATNRYTMDKTQLDMEIAEAGNF
jgi:hypothetical protein